MAPTDASTLTLEELDYQLEAGTLVRVEEAGSQNVFDCTIRGFVENDVASGETPAKVYECEVVDAVGDETAYEAGDTVRVDNRDVVTVYDE